MTPHWADLLVDRAPLDLYWDAVPSLDGAVLRSARLERDGPTLLLRLDLPGFPERPAEEWGAAECDVFQCQVRFLAVEDVRIAGWPFSVPCCAGLRALERNRIAFEAQGGGGELRFTANAALGVGHCAARRSDDPDRYRHAGRLDRMRLGTRLPETTDQAYYGRL